MKPAKRLTLNAERLAELGSDDLVVVVGASGWNPCTWPGRSIQTCYSVCELTCGLVCQ